MLFEWLLLLSLGGSPARVRIPTPAHRLQVVTLPAPTRTRPEVPHAPR